MGNEENYKNLEEVIRNWVNPNGFHKNGLLFNKNTCEPLNFMHMKREKLSVLDPENIFLLTK